MAEEADSGNFNMELDLLSQSSSLEENDLQEMEEKSRPVTTMRATRNGVKKFEDWLAKRNRVVDYHTVSAEELNDNLRKFYAEVKHAKQGSSLSPSSMVGYRAAIQRYMQGAPFSRNFNIVTDKEFTSANKMFQARCRLYYKLGNPKPCHKPVIEATDMAKLTTYFTECHTNPIILSECIWFSLCFHFGRRGREG